MINVAITTIKNRIKIALLCLIIIFITAAFFLSKSNNQNVSNTNPELYSLKINDMNEMNMNDYKIWVL